MCYKAQNELVKIIRTLNWLHANFVRLIDSLHRKKSSKNALIKVTLYFILIFNNFYSLAWHNPSTHDNQEFHELRRRDSTGIQSRHLWKVLFRLVQNPVWYITKIYVTLSFMDEFSKLLLSSDSHLTKSRPVIEHKTRKADELSSDAWPCQEQGHWRFVKLISHQNAFKFF